MLTRPRITKIALIILAIFYFLIFIPPNLTVAADSNMLRAFQIDEYVQYVSVIKITTIKSSLLETIQNAIEYGHYYYGYPFYVVSAMALIPFRIGTFIFDYIIHALNNNSSASDWTQLYILVLRQLSPLLMIFSILLLVYMWTGFKNLFKSIFLFIFLGSIPVIFWNNMWWHPDSLVTLFIILTIFSLFRDDLNFKKWFYFAAVFCGLAIGTKVIGVYFALTIPTYLLLGLSKGSINHKTFFSSGLKFLAVMILTVVVTNPLLLIPDYRNEILGNLIEQRRVTELGFGNLIMQNSPLRWYTDAIESYSGTWWFLGIIIIVCLVGVVYDNDKRLLNIIIFTWAIPFAFYLIFRSSRILFYYFIPISLPLLSCIANPILFRPYRQLEFPRKVFVIILSIGIFFATGLQYSNYILINVREYESQINQEKNSSAISFYKSFYKLYLADMLKNGSLVVLGDATIYFPPLKKMDLMMQFGNLDYSSVQENKPDLIVLQNSLVDEFASEERLRNSLNRVDAQKKYKFYRDAKNNQIKGFTRFYHDDFGTAFKKFDDASQ